MDAISGLLSGKLLGTVQPSVVIEEFLTGEEISFLVLTDGKHVAALPPAQDHKRVGEGDTGLNTGGMGVYSKDGLLDSQMSDWILNRIALPAVKVSVQASASMSPKIASTAGVSLAAGSPRLAA